MNLTFKPVFEQKGEKQFIETLIQNQIELVRHLMWTFRGSPKLDKITQGVADGNWNYIISNHWAKVYILAHQLGVNSFLDLGSGAGFGLLVCKTVGKTLSHREIQWNGVERYPELAEIALRSQIHTKEGDIMTLTKKDIEKYDCLHMYEPAESWENAQAMVNHIVSIMSPHQTVLMVSTGNMARCFRDHADIDVFNRKVEYQAVNIYKLAEKQVRRKKATVARSGQASR